MWLWYAAEFINFSMYRLEDGSRRAQRSRILGLLGCCLLLGACEKQSDRLKSEYAIMMRGYATPDEKCEKKQEIASAYLKERNAAEYKMAHVEAAIVCQTAELDRQVP